jgi:hypothetical protein
MPIRWTTPGRSRGSQNDSSPSSDDETDESSLSSESLSMPRRPPSAFQGLRSTTSGGQKRPLSPSKRGGSPSEPPRQTEPERSAGPVPLSRRRLPGLDQSRRRRWQGFADRFKAIVEDTHLVSRKRPIPERDESDDE